MCKCTPNIRTPYCGKGDCVWPGSKPEGARLPMGIESKGLKVWECPECGNINLHEGSCYNDDCCWDISDGPQKPGYFMTEASHAQALVAARGEGIHALAESVCPNIFNVGECRETITGKRCTFAANKHCAYIADKVDGLVESRTDTTTYTDTVRKEERAKVLEAFSYVEITSPGCEGWINLFFGEYPIALIDSEKVAGEIKAILQPLAQDKE